MGCWVKEKKKKCIYESDVKVKLSHVHAMTAYVSMTKQKYQQDAACNRIYYYEVQ